MNFRQLDCFEQVASSGSFTQAAAALFLSQSAVSQQVISLENELGFPLFVRTARGTELTPAGAHLHGKIPHLRSEFEAAIETARRIADEKPDSLRIGFDGPMASPWIGRAIRKLRETCGDIQVTLRQADISELTTDLLDNRLDAIVTVEFEVKDMSELGYQTIATTTACVFLPEGHPLASRALLSPADLAGYPLLVDCVSADPPVLSKSARSLRMLGIDYDSAQPVSNGSQLFPMVEAGLGLFVASHFCDETASHYAVTSVDLDTGGQRASLGVAWRAWGPALSSFVACVRDVAGEHAQGHP
ncbi:MAG: LysR family transcriptional regulator [Coriobacteriia bacterium]|nr:LysR family transcriptional regulator [Coriobacteriia bacterium]MBS5478466.1 LysR family transcriptional regulator [Coriobacteriia bacterium]